MEAMVPKDPESLNRQERSLVLRYLMFVKKKRDGTIKCRGSTDGRKQREHMTKSETSSPIVSTEAVFFGRDDRRHESSGRNHHGYTRSLLTNQAGGG